jgi:hypothetical protein
LRGNAMAKLQSNRKRKVLSKTVNSYFDKIKPLYYSGFCLTDNKNFAFFYAEDKKIIDKVSTKVLNRFKLNEADLDIIIDKTEMIVPKKGLKEVTFSGIGLIERNLLNEMEKMYPKCVYHQIESFFGQRVNSMIIVLQEEFGKPVGLFKTH